MYGLTAKSSVSRLNICQILMRYYSSKLVIGKGFDMKQKFTIYLFTIGKFDCTFPSHLVYHI